MQHEIMFHPSVESYNTFCPVANGKINRTYLNLHGCRKDYRGDKNTKVFIDNNTGKIYYKQGKGICSSEFVASLEELKEDFPMERIT